MIQINKLKEEYDNKDKKKEEEGRTIISSCTIIE